MSYLCMLKRIEFGGDGYLSINYTELIPVLIKSVQDLSAEVTELKAQVKELQSKK